MAKFRHALTLTSKLSKVKSSIFGLGFSATVTTLRSLFAIAIPSVVCRLSSVCNVGAPYSAG